MSVFYVMYIAHKQNSQVAFYLMSSILAITLFYAIFSIISGQISHYGISAIVTTSPSQSGIIYLTSVIISLIYATSYNEKYHYLLFFLGIFAVLATISRTTIIGLTVFIISYIVQIVFKSIFRKVKKNQILNLILIILVVIIISVIINYGNLFNSKSIFVSRLIERFMNLSGAVDTRQNMSNTYYNNIIGNSPLRLMFGQGKAIPEVMFNRSTLGVDNQYTRLIIEGGIVGTFIWLIMIGSWVYKIKSNLNSNQKSILYSFLLMYFVMGLGYEVFQASKSGIAFWLVLGVLYSNGLKKND